MFLSLLPSNVEYTPNILEFCVPNSSRNLDPKVDGCFHRRSWKQSPCQYTGFVCIHRKCCVGRRHLHLLVQILKDLVLVSMDGLCISCFWTLVSMQPSFLVPGGFSSLRRLGEPSLVDSLENFRLLISNHRAPSFLVPGRFFFLHCHSPDWLEIPNLVRMFPPCTGCTSPYSQVLLLLSVSHRSRLFPVLVSTWHQSQCALQPWRENFWKRLQDYIEKLIYWTNTGGDSFHFSRSFLWSECQRVGLLVSTYLIRILGSKLILSNSKSRATLWVLDTCLIVVLLPLIIILITASLSSKMYNWDSPWEECVVVCT